MPEDELLSKKELLKLTGISYGQLYRWKRQNLIPESWFIKQSSFTGQETFFPREKILRRIKMIMDLKDQYSLDELADLLTPEATNKIFKSSDLVVNLPGLEQALLEKFVYALHKDAFAFKEVVFIALLCLVVSKVKLNEQEIDDLVESTCCWLPKLNNFAFTLAVCRRENQSFGILIQNNTSWYLDHSTVQEDVFDLEELAKDLNLKLNKVTEEGQWS